MFITRGNGKFDEHCGEEAEHVLMGQRMQQRREPKLGDGQFRGGRRTRKQDFVSTKAQADRDGGAWQGALP